jgi:hypothetical protein
MAVRSDGEEPGRTYRLGACCRLRATTRSSTNCDAARHACGFKLAYDGHDTRAIQAYLGHRSIIPPWPYGFETKSVQEFLNFWKDGGSNISRSNRMVGSNKWPLNLCLERVRNLPAVLSELDHYLLVQPDIHGSRVFRIGGVVQFLCQLFASRQADIEIK